MRGRELTRKAAPYLMLLFLTAIIVWPVMSIAVNSSDHSQHYRFAVYSIADHHVSYPVFHMAIRSYQSLLPSSKPTSILLASVISFMLPLPLIIFWGLRQVSRRHLTENILICLALGLLIMSPITIWTDSKYMLGYINPIVYHNPTSNILRVFLVPLALLSLMPFTRSVGDNAQRRIVLGLVSASLLAIATLTKPSYTIALIPGMCLLSIWRFVRKRYVDWPLLALGFCLPAVIILLGQYASTYANSHDGSTMGLGFLTFFGHYLPLWRFPIQFLLSVAFPAVVYFLYFAEARKHLFLNLSWVVFGVAVMILMFVSEVGPRAGAGNFIWTSYGAIFVLMFASLRFSVEQYVIERSVDVDVDMPIRQRMSFRFGVAMAVFALHVLSGVAYYVRTLSLF